MCLVLYILFFNGEIIVCIPVLLFWLNICHAATHESQIKENLSLHVRNDKLVKTQLQPQK